ncbi:AzlD domain-containing protein [Endozoicomonas sp. SCSIO W0465]|uniref:AzlD domain-containing protein n=1 Tax=Endozoicomonas sp. SCSIO W0465 TaxID=2918516 RepID=UPI0020756EB9|nr:AzlD domain-containing protein [Endozoicomonas sp. SCSIO W0465]USE39197.1 AzlD domain-containing protein [Endozoicomonas sp. SCSIO W0465]
MDTWVILFIVAALVFGSRFLLMEPWLPLKLSEPIQQVLSYSAPAVLTAIAAPIVFIREDKLNLSMGNHYLIAAIIVVFLALVTRNTLLTVILGMLSFLVLRQIL